MTSNAPTALRGRMRAATSSLALAALLLGMTPLAAQDAAQGEMIVQPDGTMIVADPDASMEAPADPNALVDSVISADQPLEGQVLEADPAMAVDQPMDGEILEGDPAMTADGQSIGNDPSIVSEQPAILVEQQGVTGIAEEIFPETDLPPAEGELPAADAGAIPLEGELLPPVDQADAPLDGELPPPADGELLPPADAAALPSEGELLPPADQASAPLDGELLPPADSQAAIDPAPVEEEVVVVDPNAPRLQQELPAGMVRVVLQNVSVAPLDVFVDRMDGSDPVWVLTLNPGFQVVQPSEVGQTWRLAQDDAWMGGFVPSAEAEQRVTFAGAPL